MSTAFTQVFGDTPQVRLLDFLADNMEFDYTISQMAQHAELSRPTVYALAARLTKDGLLVHTRTVGRSRFYRINRAHPVVLALLRADLAKAREAGEAAYAEWRRSRPRKARKRRAVPGVAGGIVLHSRPTSSR